MVFTSSIFPQQICASIEKQGTHTNVASAANKKSMFSRVCSCSSCGSGLLPPVCVCSVCSHVFAAAAAAAAVFVQLQLSSLASVGACEMEMGVGDSGAISSVLPDEVR